MTLVGHFKCQRRQTALRQQLRYRLLMDALVIWRVMLFALQNGVGG
jgi:hypothetical protein